MHKKLKLLAVGCSRGSIVFLPTDNIEYIYARVSYHREGIVNMQEVQGKDG